MTHPVAVRIDHLALAAHDARESDVDDPAGHHLEVITRRYGSGA